jgi:hypothetical protein
MAELMYRGHEAAGKRGRRRPETIYFLGLTLSCPRNQKANFKVAMRTDKSWLRRSLLSLRELLQQIRHHQIRDQVNKINQCRPARLGCSSAWCASTRMEAYRAASGRIVFVFRASDRSAASPPAPLAEARGTSPAPVG